MAPYFQDLSLDEDEEDPAQVQISGASPTTEDTGSESQEARSPNPSTGSGFQNLDKYLQTNDSRQFGNEVLGRVGGEYDTALASQAQATEQFQNQINDSNDLWTEEEITGALENPEDANATDFQNGMTQTYDGPTNLADAPNAWSQYWSGVNQANTTAQQLGSEAGRFSLLDSYFGKPTYNFGQKSLDNLLVQRSGLGKETRGIQNQAIQLRTDSKQKAKDLTNLASQRAGEVEQNREQVLKAIGLDKDGNVLTGENAGAIGTEYQNVYDELERQNAEREAQEQGFRQGFSADNLSAEQLSALGLEAGQSLYDLDLGQYMDYGADLNRNQVMTPQQRARIKALSQLSGITDTFASGFEEEKSNPYMFHVERFKNAAAQKQGEYQRALQDTMVQMPTNGNERNTGNDPNFGKMSLGDLERKVSELRQLIDWNNQNGGDPVYGADEFLKSALPLIEQTKAKIAAQYKIDRKLNSNNAGGRAGSPDVRY